MSVETKRDAFKKIIDIRKFAVNTLEKFQKGHEGVTQKEFIDEVLYTYGIGDLEEAGPPERFNLAMSCLARDLLIQDFYNEDGKPTEYGRSVLAEYPHLDIAGYEYCGIDAGSLFDHLAVNVFDDGLRGDLEALKSLYIQNLGEPDEYPPILIAPGQIRICTNCIRVDNPTGFIPPLGGNESVVTIYKLPWHQLPKNVKKSSSWM